MGTKDVGLSFGEDVQVIVVFLRNFCVEGRIRLGSGKKRRERRWGRRGGGVGRGDGCDGVGEGLHERSVERVLLRRFLCLLRCKLSGNPRWFLCVSLGDRG